MTTVAGEDLDKLEVWVTLCNDCREAMNAAGISIIAPTSDLLGFTWREVAETLGLDEVVEAVDAGDLGEGIEADRVVELTPGGVFLLADWAGSELSDPRSELDESVALLISGLLVERLRRWGVTLGELRLLHSSAQACSCPVQDGLLHAAGSRCAQALGSMTTERDASDAGTA